MVENSPVDLEEKKIWKDNLELSEQSVYFEGKLVIQANIYIKRVFSSQRLISTKQSTLEGKLSLNLIFQVIFFINVWYEQLPIAKNVFQKLRKLWQFYSMDQGNQNYFTFFFSNLYSSLIYNKVNWFWFCESQEVKNKNNWNLNHRWHCNQNLFICREYPVGKAMVINDF